MPTFNDKVGDWFLRVARNIERRGHPGRGMIRGGTVAGVLGALGLYITTPTTPFPSGVWNTITFMISFLFVFGGFGATLAGFHFKVLNSKSSRMPKGKKEE